MSRPVLLASAAVVLAAGCWLARAALTRWRGERAARAYELVAEMRPVVLRMSGAVLCGLGATALVVDALLTGRQLPDGTRRLSAAALAVLPTPAKPAPSASATDPPRFVGIGHPAEGELLEAAVPGADGSPRAVRVWLPPHYAEDPSARYPVLVLPGAVPGRTVDAELPDVFDGLASAIKLGRTRPFVAVAPAATTHPCDSGAVDDASIRTAVAGAFRTLPPGPPAWAALGVADGAQCAVAAELTHPDLYGAAAGVSGRYDAQALSQAAADTSSGPAPRVLLAAAKDDADGLAAAHRLADALGTGRGPAPRTQVGLSDAVQDHTPERERLRLIRLAAQYLSDTLTRSAP
ncbi:hypothetical protein LN042_10650 [Kitasatospora sp. RB6PN24]|uniref:hypothetical protein n=1 Tax=Kitasatospora humi TaxID=2893891 RepID=UPI001E58A948|nr:hypothetical protein [Kitasatospora humi]MCC9307556.1 hypothetical protein [Kitasatospora humi]